MSVILALAMASAAQAAPNAAAAPAAAQPVASRTLQQDFNDASEEAASGACATAIPKFEALERGGKVTPGTLPAAAIAVRKNICAVSLKRGDADEAALQAGLPVLAKAGPDFEVDVANGWAALGDAAYRRYDYSGAAALYRKALAPMQGEFRLSALNRLAKATAFDGSPEALAYSEEALRIVSAMAKPDKEMLAAFHTLHARALLNQGRNQDAYKELKTALSLSGGLTSRTSLNEVALRSDLAMAAMLTGRKDDARLYLAYTGAGRIEKSPFKSASSMDPPLCGEETGLRPEDVAVVEFGIGEDGAVTTAHTTYSRGSPAVAAAFGQAVSQWYWRPEDIAKVPPFYRAVTRVELRCSNVLGSGSGVFGPLRERFTTWAAAQLPDASAGDEIGPTELRAILQRHVDSSANPNVRIAALAWLAELEPASARRSALNQEVLALAEAKGGLPEVVSWLKIIALAKSQEGVKRWDRGELNAYLTLAGDPAIASDALAANSLRMRAARGWLDVQLAESPAILKAVADDDRLPANHPLRQLALLDLAGRAAAAGDSAAALGYFQRTGLTEEQCALLGEAPTLKRTNVSSGDYPMEAVRMGFEGWVRTEYDIATDGKTANIRPIIAYPALIFTEAATGLTKDLEYAVSFRPGSSLACAANRETISFVLPK